MLYELQVSTVEGTADGKFCNLELGLVVDLLGELSHGVDCNVNLALCHSHQGKDSKQDAKYFLHIVSVICFYFALSNELRFER